MKRTRTPRPTLKQRVRAELEAREMTQRDLARLIGISEPSLSMKLSGVTKISLVLAFELEKHTGIPARDFAEAA